MRPALLHPSIYPQMLLAQMASLLLEDSLFPFYDCQKGHPFTTPSGTVCISTCVEHGYCIEWQPGRGWELEVIRTCTVQGATATVAIPVPFGETVHAARHLWDALRDTVMEAVRGQWEDVADRPRPDLWQIQDIALERFPVALTGFRAERRPDNEAVTFSFLDKAGDVYAVSDLAMSASVDRLIGHLEQERYEAETEYPFDVRDEDLECRTPRALGGTL